MRRCSHHVRILYMARHIRTHSTFNRSEFIVCWDGKKLSARQDQYRCCMLYVFLAHNFPSLSIASVFCCLQFDVLILVIQRYALSPFRYALVLVSAGSDVRMRNTQQHVCTIFIRAHIISNARCMTSQREVTWPKANCKNDKQTNKKRLPFDKGITAIRYSKWNHIIEYDR